MGFWGLEVKPGKPQAYNPDDEQRKLHLTQATLGDGLGKENSVIQCSIGGNAPVYLCSLLPNKTECCPLNLEFDEDDGTVEFSVTGNRSIHLTGFLEAYDEEGEEEEDDDDEDDSYGIDIGESESGESEYDDSEEDGLEDFLDHSLDMYRQSTVPNSGVVIEEIEDEEKPTAKDDKTKRSKKKSQASKDENANKQIIVKESDHAPVLESEDEDGFPIPKEKAPEPEKKSTAKMDLDDDEQGSNKKRKAKASEQESVNKNKKKKNQKEKKNEVTASKEEADEQVETGKVLEKQEASQSSPNQKAQNGAVNNAMSQSSNTPVESAEKKKKKKKKSNEEATEESKVISSRTYPNGLVVEEIKMGKPNGKKATPGKKVSVCYTGKLQKNGDVFDSKTKEAPFEFRLGVGQVIKGWDVGVNGMRVGDKRKLTIPPSMGYGASSAGDKIPPNSWLTFDVELLDVK